MQIPDDALCRRVLKVKSEGNSCKYLEADGSCRIAVETQKEDKSNRMPTLCTAFSLSMHLRQKEQSKAFWQARTAAD